MEAPLLPVLPGYDNPQLIAHGTTALVFRAMQTRLNRLVAIKVITADTGSVPVNAARELATTVSLSSQPHIVSIIDTGTTSDDRPYIVMEYCEGGSYAQILRRGGPLAVADVLEVGVKIGEALHAAHQAGIVHRDVKPSNILRSKFGPALTDFGIARAPDELSSTMTREMMTPHHASPEALLHQAQSGPSDVYSLASTLWTLLVGHPPFVDPSRPAVDMYLFRDRVLHDPVPPMDRTDVPAWLVTELRRAMAKLPADRHASAAAFAEALRRGALGLDPAEPETAPPPSASARPVIPVQTAWGTPGLPLDRVAARRTDPAPGSSVGATAAPVLATAASPDPGDPGRPAPDPSPVPATVGPVGAGPAVPGPRPSGDAAPPVAPERAVSAVERALAAPTTPRAAGSASVPTAPTGQAGPGQAGAQAGPGQAGAQAGPGQAPPGRAGPVQAGPGHAGPGQAPPGQAPPGQAPPGQAPSGQAAPGRPSQDGLGQGGSAWGPVPAGAPGWPSGSGTAASTGTPPAGPAIRSPDPAVGPPGGTTGSAAPVPGTPAPVPPPSFASALTVAPPTTPAPAAARPVSTPPLVIPPAAVPVSLAPPVPAPPPPPPPRPAEPPAPIPPAAPEPAAYVAPEPIYRPSSPYDAPPDAAWPARPSAVDEGGWLGAPASTPPAPALSTPTQHDAVPAAAAAPFPSPYPVSAPPPIAFAPPPAGHPNRRFAEADLGRRSGNRWGLIVGLAVATLLAVAAGAVITLVALRAPARSGAPAPVRTGSTPNVVPTGAGSPVATAGGPPTDVRLTDRGTSITITWVDPSGGTVSFLIAGTTPTGAHLQSQVVPQGQTTATYSGLTPTGKYCFRVGAVYTVNDVEIAPQVCTKRP